MADIESRNRSSSSMSMEKKLVTDHDNQEYLSTNVRNVLLVVVTLVVSVTFSAGVNPPGGVWQATTAINGIDYTAGEAILASNPVPYAMFLIANTIAFSTSAFVISKLVSVYPFRAEIWIAMFAMSFTYAAAITAVTPKLIKFKFVFPAFAMPVLILTFNWLRRKTLQYSGYQGPVEKKDSNWLRLT